LDLRPHIAAETLGLHGAKHDGNFENLRGFQKRDVVVVVDDDRLAIKIGDTKKLLGLKIDNRDHAVVRRQQSFFTSLRKDFEP
jgi:hypothetical protein